VVSRLISVVWMIVMSGHVFRAVFKLLTNDANSLWLAEDALEKATLILRVLGYGL
jgi:hypothetical protein